MKLIVKVANFLTKSTLICGSILVMAQSHAEGVPPGVKAGKGVSAPAAFAICSACHSVSPAGEHSIGPNLRDVFGKAAASAPNFSYSSALKKSGITWTKDELNSFLTNASAKVPGTLMTYNGIADENARKEVIEYLESLKLR